MGQALRTGPWEAVGERRFATRVHFRDLADFEPRMMFPTFADHAIDEAKRAAVRAAFAPHASRDGACFTRPMHVRLLRRRQG